MAPLAAAIRCMCDPGAQLTARWNQGGGRKIGEPGEKLNPATYGVGSGNPTRATLVIWVSQFNWFHRTVTRIQSPTLQMLMKKIEEFIHKSIAEPDNDEGLYHEQLLHNACQEVWDDLLEENVLDDLDESNFPGAMETDPESFNRSILINWLLLFICYWWTYCNTTRKGPCINIWLNSTDNVKYRVFRWMALSKAILWRR